MKSLFIAMQQCYRKVGYMTERKARNKAEKIFAERGVKLYVYDCTECGKFHLTKSKSADGRRI